jgi:hypothetical protein
MHKLQVWCRNELVGHFTTGHPDKAQKIVLADRAADRAWISDIETTTGFYKMKEFQLAQRQVAMDDHLMFYGSAAAKTFLEIHRVPDYADVFDWPETWRKTFLWAILDISPEDYEEFFFDNDAFEPV